jgi:hypothetical protein
VPLSGAKRIDTQIGHLVQSHTFNQITSSVRLSKTDVVNGNGELLRDVQLTCNRQENMQVQLHGICIIGSKFR